MIYRALFILTVFMFSVHTVTLICTDLYYGGVEKRQFPAAIIRTDTGIDFQIEYDYNLSCKWR